MTPSKIDITLSMIEREVMNVAGKFGFGEHPLVKLGLEYGKQMYGDKLRALIASVTSSDASVSAGTDVLKDTVSGCIDDFSVRLKQKLNESKELGETISGRDTSET